MKRKLLCAVLAVLFAAGLCSCGSSPEEPVSKSFATIPTAEETYTDVNGKAVPAYKNVDRTDFVPELFRTDENGRAYYDDPNVKLITGVDVSYVQADVDWAAVKADGIDFAMIRIGGRGWQSGDIYEDSYFEKNYTGAKAAGLKIGVYFFSQAITTAEAEEEARYVLTQLEDKSIDFPVAYDWEHITYNAARTDEVSPETVTACALSFCKTVADAGYTPLIYFNWTQGYYIYDLPQIVGYDFWLAEYQAYPSFLYDYKIWQYTDSGSVNGIGRDVDLNVALADHYDN